MRLKNFSEDIDSTAVLPQLDLHVMSAALERVERSDVEPIFATPTTVPEWKIADQLAALQDQITSLQVALRESENRHARLAMRHTTLLQKFEERETAQHHNQLTLNQTRNKVASLEQQLQQATADANDMRHTVTASIQQRRQREQFILKQANEIKRLRELLP